MAEQKKLYGCTYDPKDGMWHSEYGDVFTEKQLRSGACGCVLISAAVLGLFACVVGAAVKKISNINKKSPAIEQKQTMAAPQTNIINFAKER